MPVPRNRHSNARKNSRRAHHARTPKSASSCPNCGAQCLPHRLCGSCGYYRNRLVAQPKGGEE